MSARIVQVVTAEAVAVVKGEQEKEAQHKEQPAALPLGKPEGPDPGALSVAPAHRIQASESQFRSHTLFLCAIFIKRFQCDTGTHFYFPQQIHCSHWVVFRMISCQLDFPPTKCLYFAFRLVRIVIIKNKLILLKNFVSIPLIGEGAKT